MYSVLQRNLQHVYSYDKRVLGDHAALVLSIRPRNVASYTIVPGCWCGISRIGIVGSNGSVGANGVQSDQAAIDKGGKDWVPTSHYDSYKLAEKKEE